MMIMLRYLRSELRNGTVGGTSGSEGYLGDAELDYIREVMAGVTEVP